LVAPTVLQKGPICRTVAARAPSSYALLALLCEFAESSIAIVDVRDEVARCTIEAILPPSLSSYKGRMRVVVESEGEDVRLLASMQVPQLADWGRRKRLARSLFRGVDRRVADYRSQDL
jgi:hypothetical protein